MRSRSTIAVRGLRPPTPPEKLDWLRFAPPISIVVAVSHLLAVTPVWAQQPLEPDSVVLKDGQVIRGSLSEVVENDHVNVKLANGQTATIRWDAIDRLERQGAPPTIISSGFPVFVHIDADEVVLERQNAQGRWGGGSEWMPVCLSPCDKPVGSEGYYRIGGDVRPSAPFTLRAQKPNDKLLLSVSKASGAALGGGIALLSIGSLGAFVGLIITLAGFGNLGDSNGGGGGLLVGGLATMAISTGLIILGVVLINNGTSTKVEQISAVQWRVPTWRTIEGPAVATALTLPTIRF